MKYLAFILFLTTATLFAQDPFLQKDYDTVEKRAKKITEVYDDELALTVKQEMLFQKKVEEFLPRYDAIRESLEGREKLDKLHTLGEEESGEMRDILTQPQFRLYVKMKESVQPLGFAKTKN